MSIIIFLIILAILVLVHEFGHFIVAKMCGIRVDEFGLGFPPRIFSVKLGETRYTLNLIPFGGFVKIFGENSHVESLSEADKSRSFIHKNRFIQAMVLVAGVAFNMIFAWLVISLGFSIGLPSSAGYSEYGQITNPHLIVTEVLGGSPAEESGLLAGDLIVFANSGKTSLQNESLNPQSFKNLITESAGRNIQVLYKRGDNPPATIFIAPTADMVFGSRSIGVALDEMGILKLPPHLALLEGARTTYLLTKGTAISLGIFLWNTIMLKSDLSQVSGPIGIAKIVGEATQLGFAYLLSLVTLISVNLAIINLVPFPALDGGRLLFVGVEAILRRSISPNIVKWTNILGFACLIILMLVVTGHDIFNLI
ncbi:MAG TPA: site-2 protease family protein [Candidatus Paceibacterota bacterium]